MTPPDWNTYEPGPAPAEESPAAPPRPPEGRRRLLQRAAVVVAALGIVGGGALVATTLADHEEPQTVDGFTKLLDDLDDKTGDTQVFEAVIYPGYARVDVPVAPNDEREVSYRWDGGFSMEIKGTSDAASFDLADIDPALFDGMCDDVSALVDDPGDCYLIVRRPDAGVPGRSGAWISAYVSNDFSQSAWISYDRDGNEVDRSDD